ncbi:MAG: proteasome-type protease [Candidatus Tectimicrobiota bacterium]
MTFCLGMKVQQGLVALADTQIVKGSERLSKLKITLVQHGTRQIFLMTSGLRSARDKTVIYLEEQLKTQEASYERLYQIANIFGAQLRRVWQEDAAALARRGLHCNLHAIIGGQLQADAEPTLFYVYPEGNWIEAAADTPYFVLGRTPYSKPLLERCLSSHTPLDVAIGLAYLAFDMTRMSVTDVDFPLDMLVFDAARQHVTQHRFSADTLTTVREWWQQRLQAALAELPLAWAAPLLHPSTEQVRAEC